MTLEETQRLQACLQETAAILYRNNTCRRTEDL
jgi:hypothetical protein